MTCGQIISIMSSRKKSIQNSKKLSIQKIGDFKTPWNNVIKKECRKGSSPLVLAMLCSVSNSSHNNKVMVVWKCQYLKISKQWTLIKCQDHFLYNNKCRWAHLHLLRIKCKCLHHHQAFFNKYQDKIIFH